MHISRITAAALAALLALPAIAAAQDTTHTGAADTTHEAPPPAPAVKTPSLDFSGWVFGNFQVQTDDAAKAANGGKSPNKFDIERAYLTFKMPAGDRASVRVTTDIKPGAASSGYQGWFVRLKYAYLQYDYLRSARGANGWNATARIGMLHTVLIDHQETFWPRYLGKVATERFGFFSSADLGAATQITLPNKAGELYATVTNGGGYEAPEADRFKDYAARLSLTPLARAGGILGTFTISPWAYIGSTASKFAADPTTPITDKLDRNRYGVFAGIKDRRLTVAGEWAQRTDESESGDTPLARVVNKTTGQLIDGFVILRPIELADPSAHSPVGVVFRWDRFEPSTSADGDTRFITAGIFVEPSARTSLALDYQDAKPENGLAGAPSKTWFLHWQVLF
ncbi:MAG TPA: hypothetical protein VF041_19225 [Gemmatimonadaceae bacterium]